MQRPVTRWLAELIGTYGFVTIGAGAGIVTGARLGDGLLAVAVGNGVGLAVMITAFMAVSGSHLNPAITLSALIGRKIDAMNAIGYVIAQLVGATLAALTLAGIFTRGQVQLGTPGLALATNPARGLLAEAVFTFFLAIVIWGTAIDDRAPRMGGLFIGLFVVTGVLAVGPLTGGAFNPARYFGPALVAGKLTDWWLYFVGPGIGGALAGIVYPMLFMRDAASANAP